MRNILNDSEATVILTAREQKLYADIREQIKATDSNKGEIFILCPANWSHNLYQHFSQKHIEATFPKRAIDGKNPDDELVVVTTTLDCAKAEVDEFVSNVVRLRPDCGLSIPLTSS